MKRAYAFVIATGALLGMGCPTGACDGDAVDYGLKAGEGRMVGKDDWESAAAEGTWFPFTARRRIHFIPRELAKRSLRPPVVYISAASTAEEAKSAFTLASGNLAEIGVFGDTFTVYNNTCASYFVRAEVSAYPEDAGADAELDAGTSDPDAPTSNDASSETAP